MHGVDLAIGLGWLAFWAYWLASAVGVKAGRRAGHRAVGARLAVAAIAVLLLRIRVLRGHPTGDPWLVGIGAATFALGLLLAVWARIHLGRNWGTPMSQKADPELVTTGPYRWVRNPIYTGLILGMLGSALAVSVYWLALVLPLAGFFVYSAFVEQRFLAAQFPEAYPAYRRATKLLVPFVF